MNFIKHFLNKPPIFTLIFLFVTTIFGITIFTTADSIVRIFSFIVLGITWGWFLTDDFKSFLGNIFIGLTLLVFGSILTTSLEDLSPNITTVFYPTGFFVFFTSFLIFEIMNQKTFKKIMILFSVIMYYALVSALFILSPTISHYSILVVAFSVLSILSLILYLFYQKQNSSQ